MTNNEQKSVSQIHSYWRLPPDENNAPDKYVEASPLRSEALTQLFERYIPKEGRVLEVGCNAGRNLDHLYRAGYHNLAGIDISEAAIQKMAEAYPHTRAVTKIRIGPVEKVISNFARRSYDAVFTMAVLVHIHPDSEWVFAEIAKRTKKYLIIVEDEHNISSRHFRRDYRPIFENLEFSQIEEIRPFPGLPKKSYVGRVFELKPRTHWQLFKERFFD